MIKCFELGNKEFASKEEMFLALKQNCEAIISLKKSKVYKASEKGQSVNIMLMAEPMVKSVPFNRGEDYIYPVISTTRYMDSHKDVHFDGCFSKTCSEQQGKVVYALDHKLEWDSVIAWQKDVRMIISPIDWANVGKNYPGQTEGLVFEIKKSAIKRKDVLQAIEDKSAEFENSIRMVYHKLKLAANSNEKSLSEEKSYYDSKIGLIINREKAEEEGYFWGVEELGIHREGSLVVAGGSNDATRIILGEAAFNGTLQLSDPSTDSQPIKTIFNHLIIN